jgi:hypothetical protein
MFGLGALLKAGKGIHRHTQLPNLISKAQHENLTPILNHYHGVERFKIASKLFESQLIFQINQSPNNKKYYKQQYILILKEEFNMSKHELSKQPATMADIAAITIALKEVAISLDDTINQFEIYAQSSISNHQKNINEFIIKNDETIKNKIKENQDLVNNYLTQNKNEINKFFAQINNDVQKINKENQNSINNYLTQNKNEINKFFAQINNDVQKINKENQDLVNNYLTQNKNEINKFFAQINNDVQKINKENQNSINNYLTQNKNEINKHIKQIQHNNLELNNTRNRLIETEIKLSKIKNTIILLFLLTGFLFALSFILIIIKFVID